MNITHNSHVITPLKALWRWLMAEPGQTDGLGHARDLVKSASARASTLRGQVIRAQPCTASRATMRRPLRVLQVMETGQAPAQVGRIRISGRMADVCAELDRMAAHEARLLH
jgi:hypothetical protein